MKKIAFIIALILLLVGLGIFFLNDNQADKHIPSPKKEQKQMNEEEHETKQDEETEEDVDTEEKKEESKIVTLISDAVQSTIDFFTNKELEIVAIGDSLTQGVGDSSREGGYVGILDRTINQNKQVAKFSNYGNRGDRTDHLLKRLDIPEVAASTSDADIILITIGANDIMQVVKENVTNLTYNKFAEERINYEIRLKNIINKIRAMNGDAKIYLIGFYNPFEKYFPEIEELGMIVDDWNQITKEVTEEYEDLYYIPTKDLFDDSDVELFDDDHFHPNDLGYKRIAKRVLESLTEQER